MNDLSITKTVLTSEKERNLVQIRELSFKVRELDEHKDDLQRSLDEVKLDQDTLLE